MNKDLLLSKTTWGTIIGMLALIATAFGFDIGDQNNLVNLIVGILGGLFALYGRVKAVHKINSIAGIKPKPKSTL